MQHAKRMLCTLIDCVLFESPSTLNLDVTQGLVAFTFEKKVATVLSCTFEEGTSLLAARVQSTLRALRSDFALQITGDWIVALQPVQLSCLAGPNISTLLPDTRWPT